MEYIKNMMPLNLQLFAEEEEEGEEDTGDEGCIVIYRTD